MIIARIAASDGSCGTVRRIYEVVAEDEHDGLALVAADRSTPRHWELAIVSVRPAKQWDSPRIDSWKDVVDGKGKVAA